MRATIVLILAIAIGLLPGRFGAAHAETEVRPDIIVAVDGSGDYTSVHEAVQSVPKDNRQRIIVFIKDGVYKEKMRVDAACVTLRGQSRAQTRIEYPQLAEEFDKNPDDIGRAVVNVNGDDFVLENLTVANTAGIVGPHSFAIYGKADRTVIVDCDVLSEGADTVSLWKGDSGRYYHARCNFRGAVDFVCPRGWCYVTDCTFYETKNTAAVWHNGHVDKDMKFVMRNCTFDGVKGWNLARHHRDAQFFFLDCTFSATMIDKPPYRVIYPIGTTKPTEADIRKNQELDKVNIRGPRYYFHNCRRDGGDYAWHKDNLDAADGAPRPEQVTAAWTFGGKWDPERKSGSTIQKIKPEEGEIAVTFSESVTVKGKPRLILSDSTFADYSAGSGNHTIVFTTEVQQPMVASIDLNGGAIVASEAAAALRPADLTLPAAQSP